MLLKYASLTFTGSSAKQVKMFSIRKIFNLKFIEVNGEHFWWTFRGPLQQPNATKWHGKPTTCMMNMLLFKNRGKCVKH